MNTNRRPDEREEIDPLVDVDEARERPRRLDRLADQPDTGGLTDNDGDTSPDSEMDDPADIVPGEKTDIFERGTIIEPPS